MKNSNKGPRSLLNWRLIIGGLVLCSYFFWCALGGAQDRLVPLPFFSKSHERTTSLWEMKRELGKIKTKAQQDSLYELDKLVAIHCRKFQLDYKASFLDMPYERKDIFQGMPKTRGSGNRHARSRRMQQKGIDTPDYDSDITASKDWSNYDLKSVFYFRGLVETRSNIGVWRRTIEKPGRVHQQLISINEKLNEVGHIVADNLSRYGQLTGEKANLDSTYLRSIALGEIEGYQPIPNFTQEVKIINRNLRWISLFLSEDPKMRKKSKAFKELEKEAYHITPITVDREKRTGLLKYGRVNIDHLCKFQMDFSSEREFLFLWAETKLCEEQEIKRVFLGRHVTKKGKGTIDLELSVAPQEDFYSIYINTFWKNDAARIQDHQELTSCTSYYGHRNIKEGHYDSDEIFSFVFLGQPNRIDEETETILKENNSGSDTGGYFVLKGGFFDSPQGFCKLMQITNPEIILESAALGFSCPNVSEEKEAIEL